MDRSKEHRAGDDRSRYVADNSTLCIQQARSTEHLQRSTTAINGGRRTAHTDACAAQFEHGPFVDHHGDPCGNLQGMAIRQRAVAHATETDVIGKVVCTGLEQTVSTAVTDDADNVARLGRVQSLGDIIQRVVDGTRGSRIKGPGLVGLVDVDRVRGRFAAEPEVVHAARQAVTVAVQRLPRGIDNTAVGVLAESKTQFVVTLASSTPTGIFNDGIVTGIPAGSHADVIPPRLQLDFDEGIFAEVIIVARYQFMAGHLPQVVAHFLVNRDGAVKQAGVDKPFGKGLNRQQTGVGNLKFVEIDILTFRPPQILTMDDVVIAGKDRLCPIRS